MDQGSGLCSRTRAWAKMDQVIAPLRLAFPVVLLGIVTLVSTATSSPPATGVQDSNKSAPHINMAPSSHPSSSPPSVPGSAASNRPLYPGYHDNGEGLRADLMEDQGAQGIHLLLRPPDLLSPSLTHPLPSFTPPPPWDQDPSIEESWDSGSYMETLSLTDQDSDDLVLVTLLPSQDVEDGGSFDTSLPTRPTLPLSSPTLSFSSHIRPSGPEVFPAWNEDYDLEDMYPLEPTEVLLPDMNSLEYYTKLLARGVPGLAEDSLDQNTIRTSPPDPISTTITHSLLLHPNQGQEPIPGLHPKPHHPTNTVTPSITSSPTHTTEPPTMPQIPPITPPFTVTPKPKVSSSFPDTSTPKFPSNTTSGVPPPPPPGPPTHPDRSEGPSVVTEKPSPSMPPTTTRRGSTVQTSLTRPPPVTTPRQVPPTRQYLCNVTKPEMYLVRVVNSKGSSSGFSQVRELLKKEFNRSVELQFLRTPSSFAFRAVSGSLIFNAVSIINTLRRASHSSGTLPLVSTLYTVPDLKYHIHSVLQFVPTHVDVRGCSFSERVESGLTTAYTETRRRSHEPGNITVQLLNITMNPTRPGSGPKLPVDVIFAVRDGRGYLWGAEVSEHLRKLSLVEFSFYVGFPALQIAEPFHYPELNTSHHLRSTWVRTVLLGVQEQILVERSFKARLERRLALLLEEGLMETSRRRWRRATTAGNNSLQVVWVSRVAGAERLLEVFYFVEGAGGERIPAEVTAATLNRLDLQRAAIILGHRVQRPLAQPVDTLSVPSAETQISTLWLIVCVVVPVVLAVLIVIFLYWKLCGSEKLEFQPDAISTIQQRQKLQAPSVKGFDFAKLHLGQHSKDDIMVIQEPGPLPAPAKESTPPEGGELNTPKSKGSSTKAMQSSRHRARLSPSDRDSLESDQSSGRESAEESTRPLALPPDGKQHKRTSKGRSKTAPSGPEELLSSLSIFDHVDRLSRGSSDGTRRHANKVQLIAMQPCPSPPPPPPQLSPTANDSTNMEVALRHKSEMEHYSNKLRQRAKRRGQCEFPSMDDIMDAFGDRPVQSEAAQRLYSSAHDHMDCILQIDQRSPPTPNQSSRRGRRSPRGRRGQPGPGSLPDTDRDRLLTDQCATYRKYPGLNNIAYMSDPDLPPDHDSPSPTDEVFDSAPPPPPYMPPQPSIEEARQQMHSLLDDAFALVSPSSQSSAGISGRYAELGMSSTSVQSLLQRQGLSSGAYVSTSEHLQESIYSNRRQYEDEPSLARPQPVRGSTGVQLHHLTQVGLASQIAVYPGVGRSMSGPTGSSWNQQHSDQDLSRPGASRESVLSFPEFSSSSVFQMPSSALQDMSAPPLLLTSPTPEYPPDDASPSVHTSASLIKAIREELRHLAQKQIAVTSYP